MDYSSRDGKGLGPFPSTSAPMHAGDGLRPDTLQTVLRTEPQFADDSCAIDRHILAQLVDSRPTHWRTSAEQGSRVLEKTGSKPHLGTAGNDNRLVRLPSAAEMAVTISSSV